MNRDKVSHLEKTVMLHLLWCMDEGAQTVDLNMLVDDPEEYPNTQYPTLRRFLQQWRRAVQE